MSARTYLAGILALPLVAAKGDTKLDLRTILLYVLIGAAVGILARLIVPRSRGVSFGLTVVLGVIGAVVGGWLAGEVFKETEGVDWLASILVAAVLVWIATRFGRRGAVR